MRCKNHRLPAVFDDPFDEQKNPGIQLPIEVGRVISFTAWTGLSFAIWKGYIANEKWLMSGREGYDIGVPETVKRMLLGKSIRGIYYLWQCRVTFEEAEDFIKLVTIGYLLGTDFVTDNIPSKPDEHGAAPLEGELKRYWARKQGVLPNNVTPNEQIVRDYCKNHGLGDWVIKKFMARLSK